MQVQMDDFALTTKLVLEGRKDDPNGQRWDWKVIVREQLGLMYAAAVKLASQVTNLPERPEYICAIKKSGLALGCLMSDLTGIPFLWLERSSAQFLFPIHVTVRNRRIAMADICFISGRGLLRNGSVLIGQGAKLSPPIVLFDCNNLSRDAEYLNFARNHFRDSLAFVHVGNYCSQLLASEDPALIELGNLIKERGENFWRRRS